MKRSATLGLLLLPAFSCMEDDPAICVSGDCEGKMVLIYTQDSNGFYHVPLNWSGPYYPRFDLYVEGSKLIQRCRYNDVSVVNARFDTDTYWFLDDSLTFTLPLYNPWKSLYTNHYWNNPLRVGDTTIVLSQFEGLPVPVVQKDTRIMLDEYFPGSTHRKPDEYKPSDPENYLWSKRIVGTIHPDLKNDTITIFMSMIWDCGDDSEIIDDYLVRIIVE
ncbi:MAG: hypothetical protein H8E61_05155 [Bacteroidetes bacterium]|nr:hypothetical protein [Bacteroidota bacterium]